MPELQTTPIRKQKKKLPKPAKILITIVVLAVIAAIVVALLYFLVFKQTSTQGAPITQTVMRSSIQSVVEGTGVIKPANSATVLPVANGTLTELLVKEGDAVTEGQLLFHMNDTEARDAVTDAQKEVTDAQKAVQEIDDQAQYLTITAPHAGNLRDVADLQIGDTVNKGDTIATLVNDTKLRLSLYYSYTYEDSISVGQGAQITIPATMSSFSGTVAEINKVRFTSPEGATHFEVVFTLNNPGSLSEGMASSAALTAPDGTAVYPYDSGTLKYDSSTKITAKATGPVEAMHLRNYADVQSGALLVRLGEEDNESERSARARELKTAQEKLTEAQEALDKYTALSPISGTVLSCNLVAGETVDSSWAITIADTSVMTVEIKVDERNVRYVSAGMVVDIQASELYYPGVVQSVSMTAQSENGIATFPAVVTVDNSEGMLMSNMNVSYSFVASESSGCLVVPIQAVKNVESSDLNAGSADGTVLPSGAIASGDTTITTEEGVMEQMTPDTQSYTAGGTARPLGMVIISEGGMSGESGGSSGAYYAGGDERTTNIVFVQGETPPENALTANPAWECPEGFYPVRVEVGLADNVNVEIISGLNEGDEVFIGYETLSSSSW
ncbi:MAG: HlyD family efflux transporter periplasmic adaptor subunit [Oscillospiraceae bacterium]|nr:HlyD family efflux transporter periplasmic adaptor subunit [Oscillospiraceae bacterium]